MNMTTPTERLVQALCVRDIKQIRAELAAGANPNGYTKPLIGADQRVFYWYLSAIENHASVTNTPASMDALQAEFMTVTEILLDAGLTVDSADFARVDKHPKTIWVRPMVEALVTMRGISGAASGGTGTKKTRKL